MAGLGNITKIPTSGFTEPAVYNSSAACEEGHGYVIKFELYDYDNEEGKMINREEPVYARLYVVESIISTTGGIMGAKVRYQYPFEP
jgi:hypothetical protein